MASTRRLAAILAADVAGYSRLMGADEEGTHERLKAHRRELVDPKIGEHSGRIVKTTGDGMLVEFPSVVDAVRCAAELQRAMIDREAGIPEDRRIRFRIGINLGDIIVDADDIFGDGVNVAARLEALAEPGGICVSRVVRDQVRDKLAFAFDDLGEQNVKNIARPVRVYALRPEAIADLPATSLPVAIPRRHIARDAVAAAITAALVIGGGTWWLWPATNPTIHIRPVCSRKRGSAALGIGAGVVLLAWPVGGAVSLTLVLIVFFLIEGVASIMYAMEHRQQLSGRWGWMLASGIVDLILAAMIFAGLPGTAAWALGLPVGINMLFGGSALIAMALHARARGPNTSAPTL
jgi:class 3 adenylate cyclase/uncharacterized membrane protein HdeD (DUF308 family)